MSISEVEIDLKSLALARILLNGREMPFILCTLLTALLLQISARAEVLGEIHSQYRDGLIWLKVDNPRKSEPLNFLLDSGAGISVVDLRTACSLGVHLGARQIVQGVNGRAFAYRVNDLPIRICNDAFCVPVRVAGNPAHWMRLDTGCDTALEWVVTGMEKRWTGRNSIGLSGASTRLIKTSVQLGKQHFNAVTTVVRREQIFPGEAGLLGNGLLSKFCLTIDQPGNRAIFQKPM